MNIAVTRSVVLDQDDRFASLREQWHHHVRRRYHAGPDPDVEVLARVASRRPSRPTLVACAGDGDFASRVADHADGPVVASDPSHTMAHRTEERALPAVAALTAALPFPDARFDCVVLRDPRWSAVRIDDAVAGIARTLHRDGTLIATAASTEHDGHELDALVGRRLRRSRGAFTAELAGELLAPHFLRVESIPLEHTLRFPDVEDLRGYLRVVPSRRHVADLLGYVEGPIELRYVTALLIAEGPTAC